MPESEATTAQAIAIGALVAVAIVLVVVTVREVVRGGRKPVSSKGLEATGWYLYTRPGCGFCTKQLDMLGSKFKSTNVIDCGAPRARPVGAPAILPDCSDPRIVGVPFWFNTVSGKYRAGLQSREQLRAMADGQNA